MGEVADKGVRVSIVLQGWTWPVSMCDTSAFGGSRCSMESRLAASHGRDAPFGLGLWPASIGVRVPRLVPNREISTTDCAAL